MTGGHLHDVLDAAGAESGIIKSRFNGDDGPWFQFIVDRARDARRFMHGEAEPMAGVMKVADGAAGRLPALT